MSATLQRPTAAQSAAPPPPDTPRLRRGEDVVTLATVALLVAACVPLARVYVGLTFFRPVIGAVLLSFGLSWGARRLDAGPLPSLFIVITGWVMFCSAAFFDDTLFAGFLPGGATLAAALNLWARGLDLVALRPSPAFAEAGLMFLTVTGVWAVAHAVEGLVFRAAAPIRAILMSLVLWAVPLAVAPPSTRAWVWAVPLLAAASMLMLSFAGSDLRRWGVWSPAARRDHRGVERSLFPTGAVHALVAIGAGVLLAGMLPGFGDKPWYEVRGTGGTTLTTNPIVDVRARLVARDTGPIMRVVADRPVYLRTTGLDVYSDGEEWTNDGIRGAPVNGTFPHEVSLGPVNHVRLQVEVRDLPQAVLVPAPYQALTVDGPIADAFQYDRRNSTVTLDSGATLNGGDTYDLEAGIPSPTQEQLEAADVVRTNPQLLQLPENVPDEVHELARTIVGSADATTPFEQALAVQRELRGWEYSVEPPQGHGGQAMLSFIDNRVGYCEQFAGTMAVMLRSLGLPSRVAVGYTPGEPVGDDSNAYVITNANAHAWVEVLFDGLGWISFEPTPRSDGNVLVPSATNIAPSRTVAELDGRDPSAEGQEGFEAAGPDPDLRNREDANAPPTEAAAEGGAGGAGSQGTPRWITGAALLFVAALLAAAVVGSRGHHEMPGRPPLERVLHARSEVEQIGRGSGVTPAVWETDVEYLGRVAHRHGPAAVAAAQELAQQVGRARYARSLSVESAVAAEAAAGTLQRELLGGRNRLQRMLIRLRGRWSAAAAHIRAGVDQPWSSSRRRAASR
ncbi:MAG: hypothetical protein GEU74_13590 [Nitriliruptorales bacterium]|nr:hypothetical protein [Nitriliruptorales bacterium]